EGSLIIAGSILYVDSSSGLYALGAHNGRLLWNQPEGSLLTSKPANYALSQPFAGKGNPGNAFAVVGDTIYRMEMTDQGNYLATLNANNGKIVARQRVESFYGSLTAQEAQGTKQYIGSLIFEGLMTTTTSYVFPSVGRLDALDNQTGARLWSIQLAGGGSAVLTQAP
ncbi:MAG TPA: PQQ-binding-like beta-propeller repeat protein, partial [Ktedonobacteraceae bacterium]